MAKGLVSSCTPELHDEDDAAIKHTVFCNVIRDFCSRCGKYYAYCLTHHCHTQHNRCDCHSLSSLPEPK
jgi:hypothetical protein